MKVLVVVDMQVDFVNGSLGTPEAQAIVDRVVARVERAKAEGDTVFFTRDTHYLNYMETQEGRKLPVRHCIQDTEGWQLIPELRDLAADCMIMDKPTFGSVFLGAVLEGMGDMVEEVTLVGLCTDICVISNAMIAKASVPEAVIVVESDCCAGVTPATHLQALEAMKMCQIEVK